MFVIVNMMFPGELLINQNGLKCRYSAGRLWSLSSSSSCLQVNICINNMLTKQNIAELHYNVVTSERVRRSSLWDALCGDCECHGHLSHCYCDILVWTSVLNKQLTDIVMPGDFPLAWLKITAVYLGPVGTLWLQHKQQQSILSLKNCIYASWIRLMGNAACFGQDLGLPHRLQRRWTWIDSARRHRYWRYGQMAPDGMKSVTQMNDI